MCANTVSSVFTIGRVAHSSNIIKLINPVHPIAPICAHDTSGRIACTMY